jgi:hypothetical protein
VSLAIVWLQNLFAIADNTHSACECAHYGRIHALARIWHVEEEASREASSSRDQHSIVVVVPEAVAHFMVKLLE